MKLGKTLDLSKCFYDKDHWTHPDLKEGQLYLVEVKGLTVPWIIVTGTFKFGLQENYLEEPVVWEFRISGSDYSITWSKSKDEHPNQDWKHIQEVIV